MPKFKTSGSINRQVEMRAAADLVPYASNSRTHSEGQIAQIAASIREFGWTNPVLIDEKGTVIAGHGRLLAAIKLGEETVPCIVIDGLSDAQRRALIIADNKLALNAGWDEDLLASELQGLSDEGFDLALLGFGDDELATLLADRTDGLTDPDDVREAPARPVTALGDVWILGKHRIVCGDSTDAETVAKCLNGVAPHLMVTDPPYGVDYNPGWRNEAYRAGPMRRTIGAKAVGKVENDGRADWAEAWELFPGSIAYVWHGGLHAGPVQASLEAVDFEVRAQIIWNKSILVISRGHYHWKHESCWYAVKKGETASWAGDRKQSTVWDIEKPKSSDHTHGTQKPVECMKRPIENNSSPGQAVYEPFSGSGTTIIAGEMTGRSIHAIELAPAYVDVAVIRWMEFTGQTATLEATGETFEATRAKRHAEVAKAA